MKRKKIALSLSAMILTTMFAGCGGGGDSSSDSTTETTTTETPTTTTSNLSGNAVDGYVSGATVTIGEYTTTTDKNGFWEILNVEDASTHTIEVKGGTDVSTGEAFEGVLKAPVPKDPQEKIAVTPLSTVVASVVESGSTVAEAVASVAKSLGVSEDALTADPVERLKSGTPAQKAEAATIVKKSLVVQKMAETISKSASSTDEHSDAVFDAVMDSVAKALTDTTTDTTTEMTFDEVMADTTTITQSVSTQIEADETITIENLAEKLEASIKSATSVVEMVQAFDETKLAESSDTTAFLETQAKAIEVVTSTIEKAVEKIANATDVEALVDIKAQAEKTTNAITMLGGVDGIASKMEEQSAKLDNTQTLDASNFTDSFLSDEVILSQSDTFDTLEEAGFTTDMIAQIGEKISTQDEGDTTTTAEIMDAVVNDAKAIAIEAGKEFTEVDVEAMVTDVEDAMLIADTASQDAGEMAIVEVENPFIDESIVEMPEVEKPTVEEPKVEEPKTEEPKEEKPTETVEEETKTEVVVETPTVETPSTTTDTTSSTTGTTSGSSSSSSSSGSTATTTPTTKTVEVDEVGSSDASSLDTTYNFTAGNYTYTITDFNDGDTLNFPDENTPTVINSDFTDGNITVQWAYSGSLISVNLTIPTADDANIYGTTSFKTAFGADSIK